MKSILRCILTPYHLAKHDDHADVATYLMAHGVVILKHGTISAKLAGGDTEKGKVFFATNCSTCHYIRPEDAPNLGPNLWNVVGSDKASTKFKDYSPTLSAREGSWTYEDLNIFLAGPTLTRPGVNMEVAGAPDETDRVNVIAYLRTLADALFRCLDAASPLSGPKLPFRFAEAADCFAPQSGHAPAPLDPKSRPVAPSGLAANCHLLSAIQTPFHF